MVWAELRKRKTETKAHTHRDRQRDTDILNVLGLRLRSIISSVLQQSKSKERSFKVTRRYRDMGTWRSIIRANSTISQAPNAKH